MKITLRDFLKNHIWQIQQSLSLENYDVTVVYSSKKWNIPEGVFMECRVNYKYARIDICYGKDALKAWKKKWHDNLIEALCHEISHLFTNWSLNFGIERTELFDYYFEFYTSMIDRMVTEKYYKAIKKYNINKKTGLIRRR